MMGRSQHTAPRGLLLLGGLVLGLAGSWSSGCGDEDDTLLIELQLETNPAACPLEALEAVSTVAVEVYGTGTDGKPCLLARRCTAIQSVVSVAEIEDALAEANQPLIDIQRSGAERIGVIGHESVGCAGMRRMCGTGELLDVDDGQLEIPLTCTWMEQDPCSELDFPLCGQ